jgi:hypothetical protein
MTIALFALASGIIAGYCFGRGHERQYLLRTGQLK